MCQSHSFFLWNPFWATFIDILQFFSGHTALDHHHHHGHKSSYVLRSAFFTRRIRKTNFLTFYNFWNIYSVECFCLSRRKKEASALLFTFSCHQTGTSMGHVLLHFFVDFLTSSTGQLKQCGQILWNFANWDKF